MALFVKLHHISPHYSFYFFSKKSTSKHSHFYIISSIFYITSFTFYYYSNKKKSTKQIVFTFQYYLFILLYQSLFLFLRGLVLFAKHPQCDITQLVLQNVAILSKLLAFIMQHFRNMANIVSGTWTATLVCKREKNAINTMCIVTLVCKKLQYS